MSRCGIICYSDSKIVISKRRKHKANKRILKQSIEQLNRTIERQIKLGKSTVRLEEELTKKRKELLKLESNNVEKHLKSTAKKIPNKKLKSLVRKYLLNCGKNTITLEEVSLFFGVSQGDMHHVFHQLNQEGLLSQRHPRYFHDTNRNPFFGGSESGWGNDYYTILKK